jgi:hypothetical protein
MLPHLQIRYLVSGMVITTCCKAVLIELTRYVVQISFLSRSSLLRYTHIFVINYASSAALTWHYRNEISESVLSAVDTLTLFNTLTCRRLFSVTYTYNSTNSVCISALYTFQNAAILKDEHKLCLRTTCWGEYLNLGKRKLTVEWR